MLKALWSQRPSRSNGSDQTELLVDEFQVIWRRSARRTRSLALKLDRQGRIIVMTPQSITIAELSRFVRSRADWIRRQCDQYQLLEARKTEHEGRTLWLLGEQLEIVKQAAKNNLIENRDGVIHISSRQPVKDGTLSNRLSAWLRAQADECLPLRLDVLSKRSGLLAEGLQIKAYTARWGSCRHDGVIQLNWKLIKAPLEVIDYVILHELSHLRHFNHSPAFWQLVAKHCPAYQQQRRWLKDHGRLLLSTQY